jgi:hypothetical protein
MTVRYVPVLRFDLQALGISLPSWEGEHPNRVPFQGVLTRVNEPSTRPPHGAQGHRVLIPAAVAEQAIPSLIGMAIDVSEDLTDHTRQKIGIITSAWLDGHDLRVEGFLYGKDFPDLVERLREERESLGMSYEITQVAVEDEAASIWTLADYVFTGAAILRKRSAAYEQTSLMARRERRSSMTVKALKDLELLRDRISGTIAAMKEDEEDETDEEKAARAAKEHADAEATRRADEDARRRHEDEDAARRRDEEAARRREDETARRQHSQDDEEHEDEEQDVEMLKKLLTRIERRQGGRKQAARRREEDEEDAASVTSLEAAALRRELRQLKAAQELLTDTVTQGFELMTDMAETVKQLATDRPKRGANGGHLEAREEEGERRRRKTMSASESHQFLSKYGLEEGKSYTVAQIDAAFHAAGITDPTQRIAAKHFLEANGQLAAK